MSSRPMGFCDRWKINLRDLKSDFILCGYIKFMIILNGLLLTMELPLCKLHDESLKFEQDAVH